MLRAIALFTISVLGAALVPITSASAELTLSGAIKAAFGFLADFLAGAFFAAFLGAAFLGAAFLAAAFFGAAFDADLAAFLGAALAAFFAGFLPELFDALAMSFLFDFL